jgi:hypothetical protein
MGGSPPSIGSGPVDYPAYMKSWHGDALSAEDEVLNVSLTTAMNETFSVNPYLSLNLLDPDAVLLGTKMLSDYPVPFSLLSSITLLDFATVVNNLREISLVNALQTDVNPLIDNIVEAEASLKESQQEQNTLSIYKANLRSINAVMCSSFVVGEAILRGKKIRPLIEGDITQRQIGIRTQAILIEQAEVLTLRTSIITFQMRKGMLEVIGNMSKLYTTVVISLDNNNLEIVAKENFWTLQVFQYGGNFLGSIKGKIALWVDPGEASVPMTYGQGILSGTALGAQIGSCIGPVGTVVGAVIGAVVGAVFGYIANEYGYASASDAAINMPIDVTTRGTFLQRFLLFGFGW